MGQKTNPNILRLGKTKEWKSKYLEKKSTELSSYTFKDIEIQKFLTKFFERNGLYIQNCKLYHSESSLYVYASYYNLGVSQLANNKLKENNKIKIKLKRAKSKPFQKKNLSLKKKIIKKQLYSKKSYQKFLLTEKNKSLFKNSYFFKKETRRLDSIKNYKMYQDAKKHKTLNNKNSNLFIKKIFKNLSLFTKKQKTIFLNLKQINKESNLLQTFSKKKKQLIAVNLIKLRKFQQNEFFKKGINILYSCVSNNQTANFLAKFITFYLKKLKRPNFFLRFLKTVLKLFISKEFSKFERIQIKIKGRFNGAPRSTNKFVNIDKNIPVLTINSKIDYGKSTSYTSNGTFGVKVWTYTT